MSGQTYTAYEMLERLVAFDTTSRNSNLALIEFVEDYLSGHGIESRRVFDDSGAKANLFATIPGSGGDREGGVVLSGHTDVVPVDDQDWTSDPFTLQRRDDRLFGRGSADMKGFLAVALAAVADLPAAGIKRPVHLAFSYDEEVGCLGAPRLVAMIRDLGVRPQVVIVGEPTMMKVANRHKGVCRLRTTVTGREAHSAYTDRGISANLFAGDILAFLHRREQALREQGGGADGFDPPYHSLHVGLLQGGTATNIIPRHCVINWEMRLLPGGSAEELVLAPLDAFVSEQLLPRMRNAAGAEGAVSTRIVARVPGLAPERNSDAEALVRALAGDNEPAGAVSFGTEAGLFQAGDMAAVICGPGSILQAHSADEYIDVEQIEACRDFMQRLFAYLAR